MDVDVDGNHYYLIGVQSWPLLSTYDDNYYLLNNDDDSVGGERLLCCGGGVCVAVLASVASVFGVATI